MARMTGIFIIALAVVLVPVYIFSMAATPASSHCLTGAFIADLPTTGLIEEFRSNYGKRPYFVMIFVDWGRHIDEGVIKDVYSAGSVLMVTWEPWKAETKEAVDYEGLLAGRYDDYIKEFAARVKSVGKDVYIRFAHEMNGDWYPWSAAKIGGYKYIALYRYVKDIFDRAEVRNARWVFSVNWEDIPGGNDFEACYPGPTYVDYFGIDGYNWGDTQSWSKWMTFAQIFGKRYKEIAGTFAAPIIITEFGSAPSGGDKALWIKEAMSEIRKMDRVKGFVLFNVNKETEWSLPPNDNSGRELRRALADGYFADALS